MQNPEQSKNLTQPQESIGRTLSRRDFLKAAGMVGAAVLANRYLGPLVGVEGAPLPLGADVIFSNLKKEQEALEAKPDTVYGWTFKTDAAGGVTDFYAITEAYSQDDKRTPLGRYLFKSSLDATTGKFSKFNPISSRLPIAATSIAVYGNALLLGGEEFPFNSGKTALLYIPDDKPLTQGTLIANLPITEGRASEIKLLPNTGKAMVSVPGFEINYGSMLTFDFNTRQPGKESWSGGNWATRTGLTFAATADGKARLLSPAFSGSLNRGYVDMVMDPVNGQILSSQLKHPETSFAQGLAVTKDQASLVDKIFVANIDRNLYIIDDRTDTVQAPIYLGGLLDGADMPSNYDGPLDITPILVKGNILWGAGNWAAKDGNGRAVLTASSLVGSFPNISLNLSQVYQLEDNKPSWVYRNQDLQFGVFNGKPGLLVYASNNLGFAFIETASDGTPLPGIKPLYLGQGLGELHQTFLPYLGKAA